MYTFVSPLSSSMMAPGLLDVAKLYHITNEVILGLTLSIFLLSFALGVRSKSRLEVFQVSHTFSVPSQPLVLAPLSEMYGRTWVRASPRFFRRTLRIVRLDSRLFTRFSILGTSSR